MRLIDSLSTLASHLGTWMSLVCAPWDRVAIRGRFYVDEDCYRIVHGLDPDEGNVFCWPVEAPMFLVHPQFEVMQ